MLEIVNKYKPNVTRALGQRIGYSKVYLEQEDNICRLRECNLGNLMTDAYFAYYADKNSTDPSRWSDVNGAVLNGGTIRAPLPQGVIKMEDVMQTAPFGQTIVVVSLYGKYLQQMFEHSVANYSYKNRKGQFLQVSGMRVTYNLTKPPHQRVVSINILCTKCQVPVYEPLEECEFYNVVTTDFVARGGDGFTKAQNVTDSGPLDLDVLVAYINKTSPIKTPLEDRITIYGNITKDD